MTPPCVDPATGSRGGLGNYNCYFPSQASTWGCRLKVHVMIPPPFIAAHMGKDRGVLNIGFRVAIVAPVVGDEASDFLDRRHPHIVKNYDAVPCADRIRQEEI